MRDVALQHLLLLSDIDGQATFQPQQSIYESSTTALKQANSAPLKKIFSGMFAHDPDPKHVEKISHATCDESSFSIKRRRTGLENALPAEAAYK